MSWRRPHPRRIHQFLRRRPVRRPRLGPHPRRRPHFLRLQHSRRRMNRHSCIPSCRRPPFPCSSSPWLRESPQRCPQGAGVDAFRRPQASTEPCRQCSAPRWRCHPRVAPWLTGRCPTRQARSCEAPAAAVRMRPSPGTPRPRRRRAPIPQSTSTPANDKHGRRPVHSVHSSFVFPARRGSTHAWPTRARLRLVWNRAPSNAPFVDEGWRISGKSVL